MPILVLHKGYISFVGTRLRSKALGVVHISGFRFVERDYLIFQEIARWHGRTLIETENRRKPQYRVFKVPHFPLADGNCGQKRAVLVRISSCRLEIWKILLV